MAIPFNVAEPEDELRHLLTSAILQLSRARIQFAQNNKFRGHLKKLMKLLLKELNRSNRSSRRRSSRRRRRRYCSLSSDSENNSKFSDDDTDEEPYQVGLVLRKISDCETTAKFQISRGTQTMELAFEERTLLARLVVEIRRTLCLTMPMVCVVGWHWLQLNYFI